VLDPKLPSTLDCVHCGLCLSACPTYRITGRENSSPRGRVYLMRGVVEERIELTANVADELHLCLGCRACESACPSGVEYGALLEVFRDRAANEGVRRGLAPKLERFALRAFVARPNRLGALVSLLGAVQRSGLLSLAARILPRRLASSLTLVPHVPVATSRRRLPAVTPARGEQRGRVALLEGCVMPEFFGDVNRDTVRVLSENGFEVIVPESQGCCGALHAHAGDLGAARELARTNLAAFASPGGQPVDAVISNSAGCGAALQGLEHWLPGEGTALADKVLDVCAFLDAQGLRERPARLAARVCYDDPCHLIHGQNVAASPRRILESIEGLVLVPHTDADHCCGAAGTYNLTHPEMSEAVRASKLDHLEAAAPEIVATGNPGCMLQIAAGAKQRGVSFRVAHPISLLAEAYAATD
jgi:glycolate oxidase iron-sulfur subunit